MKYCLYKNFIEAVSLISIIALEHKEDEKLEMRKWLFNTNTVKNTPSDLYLISLSMQMLNEDQQEKELSMKLTILLSQCILGYLTLNTILKTEIISSKISKEHPYISLESLYCAFTSKNLDKIIVFHSSGTIFHKVLLCVCYMLKVQSLIAFDTPVCIPDKLKIRLTPIGYTIGYGVLFGLSISMIKLITRAVIFNTMLPIGYLYTLYLYNKDKGNNPCYLIFGFDILNLCFIRYIKLIYYCGYIQLDHVNYAIDYVNNCDLNTVNCNKHNQLLVTDCLLRHLIIYASYPYIYNTKSLGDEISVCFTLFGLASPEVERRDLLLICSYGFRSSPPPLKVNNSGNTLIRGWLPCVPLTASLVSHTTEHHTRIKTSRITDNINSLGSNKPSMLLSTLDYPSNNYFAAVLLEVLSITGDSKTKFNFEKDCLASFICPLIASEVIIKLKILIQTLLHNTCILHRSRYLLKRSIYADHSSLLIDYNSTQKPCATISHSSKSPSVLALPHFFQHSLAVKGVLFPPEQSLRCESTEKLNTRIVNCMREWHYGRDTGSLGAIWSYLVHPENSAPNSLYPGCSNGVTSVDAAGVLIEELCTLGKCAGSVWGQGYSSINECLPPHLTQLYIFSAYTAKSTCSGLLPTESEKNLIDKTAAAVRAKGSREAVEASLTSNKMFNFIASGHPLHSYYLYQLNKPS